SARANPGSNGLTEGPSRAPAEADRPAPRGQVPHPAEVQDGLRLDPVEQLVELRLRLTQVPVGRQDGPGVPDLDEDRPARLEQGVDTTVALGRGRGQQPGHSENPRPASWNRTADEVPSR